jgi:hypothetical protein
MIFSKWLARSSCAFAFATIVGPAWSSPFVSVGTLVDTTTASRSQQVAHRVCTIQGGVRRCYRINAYGPGAYGYKAPLPAPPAFYGYRDNWRPTDPNDHYIGTGYWWRGMDRFDKGGTH